MEKQNQAKKKILVAGGSRGLGRATAIYFAERGYLVDVAYHKSSAQAASLETIAGIRTRRTDLSQKDQVKALAQWVAEDGTDSFAGLVFTCGCQDFCLYDLADVDHWQALLEVNLSSALYLAQEFRSLLLAQETSGLVLTSSVWGQTGAAMETLYSTTKAGLIGLGKSLAKELASAGVRVNVIAPGVMETDMLAELGPEDRADLLERIPLARFGSGEDFAKLCYYLIDRDRYMTGQVLALNGGFYI